MVSAVVVNKSFAKAEHHAAVLRASGYLVELCGGPDHDDCPVLAGLPCRLADGADILIYDALVMADNDAVRQLVADVRDVYPDLPIVLTSAGPDLAWVETEGPLRVFPLAGEPSSDELRAAVEAALPDQGMAV